MFLSCSKTREVICRAREYIFSKMHKNQIINRKILGIGSWGKDSEFRIGYTHEEMEGENENIQIHMKFNK